MANLLVARGDAAQAWRHHQQALAHAPHSPEVLTNAANCLRALGQTDTAATHYQRAIELNGHYSGTRCNYAVLLQGLGRLEAAAEQLNQVLSYDSQCALAHFYLAMMALARGNVREGAARDEWRRQLVPAWRAP